MRTAMALVVAVCLVYLAILALNQHPSRFPPPLPASSTLLAASSAAPADTYAPLRQPAPVMPMAPLPKGAPRYQIHALPFSDTTCVINDLGEIATTVPTGKRAMYSERPDDIPDQLAVWKNGRLYNLGNLQGNEMCWPVAINNRGEIVGQSGVYQQGPQEDYAANAFLWSHGHMQKIMDEADIAAMNDQGVIVGTDRSSDTDFVYAHGKERKMPGPFPRSVVEISAINNKGEMVGSVQPAVADNSDLSAKLGYSCLWNGGKAIRLQFPPDWVNAFPRAINNSEQIIVDTEDKKHYIQLWSGRSSSVEDLRPVYLWQAGKWRAIDPPPGRQEVEFAALNDRGEVIGNASPDTGDDNAPCLWKDGRTYSLYSLILNNSGWVLGFVGAINNRGEIVGWGTINGKKRAFLLTPAEEGKRR